MMPCEPAPSADERNPVWPVFCTLCRLIWHVAPQLMPDPFGESGWQAGQAMITYRRGDLPMDTTDRDG
jgi:hypothetical protein